MSTNDKKFQDINMLETIFKMQNELDEDIKKKRGLEDISSEEWIQKKVLAMLSELAELLDEVNFKWWKNPKEVNKAYVKEELVDVLHFFVSMCLSAGMSAEELFEIYISKNKENFDRQLGKSKKEGYDINQIL